MVNQLAFLNITARNRKFMVLLYVILDTQVLSIFIDIIFFLSVWLLYFILLLPVIEILLIKQIPPRSGIYLSFSYLGLFDMIINETRTRTSFVEYRVTNFTSFTRFM